MLLPELGQRLGFGGEDDLSYAWLLPQPLADQLFLVAGRAGRAGHGRAEEDIDGVDVAAGAKVGLRLCGGGAVTCTAADE